MTLLQFKQLEAALHLPFRPACCIDHPFRLINYNVDHAKEASYCRSSIQSQPSFHSWAGPGSGMDTPTGKTWIFEVSASLSSYCAFMQERLLGASLNSRHKANSYLQALVSGVKSIIAAH